MTLDFWLKTSGTWINILTVLIGTTIGLILREKFAHSSRSASLAHTQSHQGRGAERSQPQKIQLIITQGVGLLTLWIGFSMTNHLTKVQADKIDGTILGLLAIILGGVLGEWLEIEEKLANIGNWLKRRFRGKGRFTEGFVASSLLFCVGPMTLVGCLNNGLTGDNTLLSLKATMDGIVAIALANIYGIGVGFSLLVILFYQGGLSLLAGLLANSISDPANDPRIFLVTGVGGLMIIGIGINLLEITKIRVASFLPAIAIAPIIYQLGVWLSRLVL
ncbi:hypothetical protein STA3757_42680 [Stanieria sp. NIES-3757]|nr:hypothetical protein STA3757_42680 [Stanieria sp. NIES-3757]